MPGYVSSSNTQTNQYRVGDHISVTMVKGGGITGKIIDAVGRSVAGSSVKAVRVRDEEGHKINESNYGEEVSDDRGVYRSYGLRNGTYLIKVSRTPSSIPNPRFNELPTYFPSVARDTAQEITVKAGAEITGIDVAYRGESGHIISGTIANSGGIQPASRITIQLRVLSTGTIIGSAFVNTYTKPGFAFYAVPDGEYEITATQYQDTNSSNGINGIIGLATPLNVTIRSSNVSGLILNFTKPGEITGRVTLEKMSGNNSACQPTRNSLVEEILVNSIIDTPGSRLGLRQRLAPNNQGDFSVSAVSAGTYRFSTQLPVDFWYLKAVTRAAKPAKIDVATTGISVKAGDKISGLSLLVAEGAASLQGKIMAELNQKLPSRMRVHAIPTKTREAENLLRYFEVITRDSTFNFTNLPPGKYWLYVEKYPETETLEKSHYFVAWEAKLRVQLRQAAEAAKQLIELSPCQKVKDFGLMVKVR